MAHTNDDFAAWVIKLLEVEPNDRVLEVRFGPGIAIKRLSELTVHVTGIDQSREMVAQTQARNASAINRGSVELHQGSVSSLPFVDNSFNKVMALLETANAINRMRSGEGCSRPGIEDLNYHRRQAHFSRVPLENGWLRSYVRNRKSVSKKSVLIGPPNHR